VSVTTHPGKGNFDDARIEWVSKTVPHSDGYSRRGVVAGNLK